MMKQLYTLSLSLFLLTFTGFGQFEKTNVKVIDNLHKFSANNSYKKSNIKPQVCGKDTVEYPRYKASKLYFIGIKKGYSLGQFYSAPQDITIHGFTFYSFIYANPPSTSKVRVICNIYKAGVDSLPTGSPLRSDTITVDSTYGAGFLSNVTKNATFKTPITVNYPYILTVESDSAFINASVVANDWSAGNGKKMNLLCGSVTGRWYRGLNLNIGGVTLDADVLLHPHISYKLGTDFTFKDCSDMKDSVKFKNANASNVSGSSFYNRYTFYNLDWFCHYWNYGDVSWNNDYIVHGVNKYAGRGNYKVRLITTVYQWHYSSTGNAACSDTTEKIIYFKPINPYAMSSTNICKGDSANILLASDTGTVIKWYKNPVDTKPVFVGPLYRLGKPSTNDTFYVKAVNYSCESGFSTIIISVNDYPKNPSISNDSICNGARANLAAKSNIGMTEWFTDSTKSKSPFYFGDLYQTQPLNTNESYFVRSNNGGCYSPSFKTVTAYVDNSFAPDDPIVSKDTVICLRPSGKAVLKAFNNAKDTILWYNVPSGGTSIAKGSTYTFNASAKGNNVLYVEARKSTCASSRLGINVKVSDYPTITQKFADVKCKGDTAIIGVSLSTPGDVKWYANASGGTFMDIGYVIKHYTNKSKDLYAEASEGVCVNPARTAVNIKINAYDSITKVEVPIVCGTASAMLKVTAGSNVVKWYEDEALKSLVQINAIYNTPNLLVSTNYFFTVEKNGCVSPVNMVRVDVLPLPIPGYKDSIIKGHKIRFTPYATTGVKFKWRMGDGNILTTRVITYAFASYGKYTVTLIVTNLASGCVDSLSKEITFDFSGIKSISEHELKVFPNPTSSGFTVQIPKDFSQGNLQILSLEGKTIYKIPLTDNKDVEFREPLAKGLYYIKLDWNDKISYTKLLVN